jgi:AcrR family transcriptional regulator
MNKVYGNMTISDLTRLSNIPASTIKFYLRKKLLPKPIKTGATRAYYTIKHLDRLKLIKKIQKESNLSLNKIKEITAMIDAADRREQRDNTQDVPNTRSKIMQSAVNLFRKKGYESVTVSEIVASAQIGCSTFYRCFPNKKELFIECIHEIISSQDIWAEEEDISDEQDIFRLFDIATKVYRETGTVFRDMMDQLHAAAINNPGEFADKMDEVIQLKIQAFEETVQKGMDKGLARNFNKTVLAVMLYGIEEATHQYSSRWNLNESQQDAIGKEIMEILLYGILKK